MENDDRPTGHEPWTLGDRLRKSRELAGYRNRTREFCEKVDISDNSRRRYETDVTVPPLHVIIAWSVVTEMSVDWLLTGEMPVTGASPLASQHLAGYNDRCAEFLELDADAEIAPPVTLRSLVLAS